MAKMKQGTQTGKVDCNLNGIRVGGHLCNPDGEMAKVNEYGSLCIVGGEEIPGRKWDGSAWEIVPEKDVDIVKAALLDDAPVAEAHDVEPSDRDTEVAEDAEPAAEDNPCTAVALGHFSDSELLDELRLRGYTGNLTHTITIKEEVTL